VHVLEFYTVLEITFSCALLSSPSHEPQSRASNYNGCNYNDNEEDLGGLHLPTEILTVVEFLLAPRESVTVKVTVYVPALVH
jgi:hypothetical protein